VPGWPEHGSGSDEGNRLPVPAPDDPGAQRHETCGASHGTDGEPPSGDHEYV